MKIEAGKCYVLRNGTVTQQVEHCENEGFPWAANVNNEPTGLKRCVWTADGKGYGSERTDIVGVFASVEDAQMHYGKPTVTKASLLDDAKAAVADRGLNYGKPEDNFARIARLWSAHVQNRYAEHSEHGVDLSPWDGAFDTSDVALMMILLKIARLENEPTHQDSIVDMAGYAACLGEIADGIAKDA